MNCNLAVIFVLLAGLFTPCIGRSAELTVPNGFPSPKMEVDIETARYVATKAGIGFDEQQYIETHLQPTPLPVSVLTQEKARSLFDVLNRDEAIEWSYLMDYDIYRANLAAEILARHGVKVAKLFVEGDLCVKYKNLGGEISFVEWVRHVSAVAYVMDNNGEAKLMAFDPQLSPDGPLSVDDLKSTVTCFSDPTYAAESKITDLYFGDRFHTQLRSDGSHPLPYKQALDLSVHAQELASHYLGHDKPRALFDREETLLTSHLSGK